MVKYLRSINDRKGMAERVGVVMFIVSFAAVLITLGVTVLVLDAFNTSLDTDGNASTIETGQAVFGDGVLMITNFTGQLGTVGTIAGILILVILVSLAGLAGYGYSRNKGYM